MCRPLVETPQERRMISKEVCADVGLGVTLRTIRLKLVENGLNGCIVAKKPPLRLQYVEKR